MCSLCARNSPTAGSRIAPGQNATVLWVPEKVPLPRSCLTRPVTRKNPKRVCARHSVSRRRTAGGMTCAGGAMTCGGWLVSSASRFTSITCLRATENILPVVSEGCLRTHAGRIKSGRRPRSLIKEKSRLRGAYAARDGRLRADGWE